MFKNTTVLGGLILAAVAQANGTTREVDAALDLQCRTLVTSSLTPFDVTGLENSDVITGWE